MFSLNKYVSFVLYQSQLNCELIIEFYLTGITCPLSQVFDATNSTIDRRKMIHEIVVDKMGYKLFFVESVCDDPSIIEQNIMEVKVSSPDYQDMNREAALQVIREVICY